MNPIKQRTGSVFAAVILVAFAGAPFNALGQVSIGEAACAPGIFRLSLSAGGQAGVLPSLALAEGNSAPSEKVDQAGWVGVRTAQGALLASAGTGRWKLLSPDGRTLVEGIASSAALPAENGGPRILTAMKWSGSNPPRYYGSGNDVASIVHQQGRTSVKNGIAVIPYFWSSDGYAVLVVSQQGAAPAQWTSEPENAAADWAIPGTAADLYLMPAPDLKAAAVAYGELSGRAPVPPRWAFGYLQSRWGWEDRSYIEQTLHEFRSRQLPLDAFIFDFEWYTPEPDYEVPPQGLPNFTDFGWNPRLFPDPAGQIAAMKEQGVRFVGIRKPRLGDDQTLKFIRDSRWSLEVPNQKKASLYDARDMDFGNPLLRQWYADRIAPLLALGVDGWWNDEGEATLVNYYYWNEAERVASERVHPGCRFWSINRAFQPGLQRLGAAAWTGDISSTWASLAATPASLLNWSLAGMPYGACDIGGFTGDDSPELLVRWMQAGVFFPVMRTHSTLRWHSISKVTPRFPWLYGPEAEAIIRQALDLRYRLLPLYYSLAHEQSRTGLPLMRPMAMEFPGDANAADLSDQWMMGDGLMAAPVLQPGDEREVYLPAGTWYRFETAQRLEGGRGIIETASLHEIPVFVRAGSIVPLGPVLQTTSAVPGGPLELQVYAGANATFTLFEDDGETLGYAGGAVRLTTFSWDDAQRRLTWRSEGRYSGPGLYTDVRFKVFDARGSVQGEKALGSSGEWVAP